MTEEVNTAAADAGVETAPAKQKITLDQSNMTLGDYEEFEEITKLTFSEAIKTRIVRDEKTGVPIPDPENPGKPLQEVQMSMKSLVALLFISERKKNPSVTMDDIRAINLSEVDFEVPADQAPKASPPLADASAARESNV